MASISIPSLAGGVSRAAQSQRPSHVVEEAENVILSLSRGAEKRAGTEYIQSPDVGSAQGELDVTDPTNAKHVGWIDRSATERFVYLIDPAQGTSDDEMVEIFSLAGAKQTVAYHATNPRPYIANGSGDPRRRLRSLSIADATFILNKTKVTALAGAAITYIANGTPLRNTTNANNLPSWSDFPHPPNGTTAAGDLDDDDLYYAREDDVGQPQGFYAGISTTQPPWYERRRTEGANSTVDATTMPVKITYSGATFTVAQNTWTDRLAGDSATNPGATFIGGTLSDMALHQGRMFFAGGERVFGSQAADLFNLWQNSAILQVDSDPVDARTGNNRVSNIDHLTSFRESLMMTTTGGRQFELRSDGPLAPGTSRMEPSTSYQTVPYVQPCVMGDQLYFAGERNFANIIYEYYLSDSSISNSALDITQPVEGYLPAEISLIEPAEAHDMLFVLTDAQTHMIYVYKTTFNGTEKVLTSWYRWITDTGNEILSIKSFDDDLYILLRRNSLIWLEKVAIEQPAQDVIGDLTMGYAVRLDRRSLSQGTYTMATHSTEWILPFEDNTITEIVLGPEWDADFGDEEQRLKGTRIIVSPTPGGGETSLLAIGQYETNIAGDPAQVYAGRPYEMDIELSEQFMRDQQNRALLGNVQLLKAVVRYKDTGYFRVDVTPFNRRTFSHEFVFPRVGSTEFDSSLLDETGEFQFRVLAAADNCSIHITNDSPMPSNIVDMEFVTRFIPQRGSPMK